MTDKNNSEVDRNKQTENTLHHTLGRIEGKLDVIHQVLTDHTKADDAVQGRINNNLAINNASLNEHMRRTDLLELEVKTVKASHAEILFLKRFVIGVSALLPIIYTALHFMKIL